MTKSRKIELALQLTLIVIGLIAIRFLLITGFTTFETQYVPQPAITIDGDFNDWTPVLNNPASIVVDGPWANLTDLDSPKSEDDLIRFASTFDNDYIYFYFERNGSHSHEHTRLFTYVDSNNNGLMEAGEPVLDIKWPKDEKAYTLSVGVYKYGPDSTGGDTMTCGDGCTMPGKQKKIWKNIEKLRGNSADAKKIEVRVDWDWLNVPIKPDCKSCHDIFSLTMQLSEPLTIATPTNVSIYDEHNHLLQKIPITPANTTFTITDVRQPQLNVTVDGTNFSELIDTSCNEPIGENMTFDEFDILVMDASQKKECVAPVGFEPKDLQLHISSSKGGEIPHDVADNMNWYALTANITPADTTPPTITLISPANGTISGTGDVVFEYVANDAGSGIDFCSLIIDGVIDQANLTVTEGMVQSFTKTGMPAGTYVWSVNCTDDSTNANVGASETNSLQISTAPPTDTLPPAVSSVQPPPGQDLAPNANITISAIVMDNVAVDTVYAFIILPDYTTAQVPLASIGSALYSAVFTDTSLFGRYDVIIVANDTSGNVNNAVTTWFNVSTTISFEEDVNDSQGNPLNVTVLIINITTGEIVYNSTEDHHNTTVTPGTYHVVIIPPANYSSITNLTFWDVNITTSINQLVDLSNIFDIRYLDPNVIYNNVFAANLILTAPYSHATVYFVATAPSLYKCRVFDFEDQICYGQWIKMMGGLIPGQVYGIDLVKGDPAFGEGTDKMVLTTITVNGNMNDWAAVLDNPNNILIDGVSGVNDADNVSLTPEDLTKAAFTWDSNNMYWYFRRVYDTTEETSIFVYLDYGMDGYMNSTDKVLKVRWKKDKQYDLWRYDYTPNGTADVITGDGFKMPGTITNGTKYSSGVHGGSTTNNIEVEASIPWSTLGVPAGSPFKFHVSLAAGDTTDVPAKVRDNMILGSSLLVDVLISPDNTAGSNANNSLLYNHTIKNLGNFNDTFDITTSSSKNFTVQLLWPNGTALTDTDGDSVVDIGKLSPSQSQNITVNITIPAGTATGTKDITRITATSSLNTNISSTSYDTTFVGGLTITPAYFGRIANNTIFIYNHTVRNNLNLSTVIDLGASSDQGWTNSLLWPNGTALTDTDSNGKIDVGNVSAGSSKDFLLRLSVPANATESTVDGTIITANSSSAPANSGFVKDRTTVAKRIEVEPDHTGDAGISDSIFYEHEVFNNWNSSDIINLNYSSSKGWSVTLYKADKVTLLNDTNSDGKIDAGSLAYAGGSAKIAVKVIVSASANETDIDSTKINGTSSINSNISDIAIDNTTARILVLYNDSSKTLVDYNYTVGEIVYATAYGLSVTKVYFRWIDGNTTIVRTSPNETVDLNKQAVDNFTTNSSYVSGNWTLIIYNALTNVELARRDFLVMETTPPVVTNVLPSAGTNYNQSAIVDISANVTDNVAVDTVLASITLPNSTIEQITLSNIANSSGYSGNFTDTNLTGRYNITIIANDTSSNVNNTEKTWFNITSACTSNITNTSWSAWTNLSCAGSQMNQSRFLTQYDANNCGPANQTFYEYQLVGPEWINGTWTGWYNVTTCLPGDYYTQERNMTQHDNYSCAANQTFFEYQNQTCDFCTPNITNTSWTGWYNTSACYANNTIDQARNKTQYDTNNCNETVNQTFFEYGTAPCDYDGAPRITITSPIISTYDTALLLVNISVNDSAIDKIWYNWNGTNVTYTTPVNVTFGEGGNTLVAYANDTIGNLNTTSVSFTVDTTAPSISGVNSTATATTVHISWNTNELANSTINYGINSSLGTFATNSTFELNHTVFITGLVQGTTYYYNITSCDASGNCNTTGPYNFTTTIDMTPPGAITGLSSPSQGVTWIYWNWINPTNIDFYQNIIYLDGINIANTSNNFSNATGLAQNTTYTITINTKDFDENVNATNVSNTNETLPDITSPVISNVTVQSITNSSAQILLDTDELANATIEYGTTLALGSNASDASFALSHTIPLAGLSASTMYFFNVTSCDQYDNCMTSGPYNFTTSSTPIIPPGPGGGGGGGGMGGGGEVNATTNATVSQVPTFEGGLGLRPHYIGNFLYAQMYNYTQVPGELWIFTYKYVNHTVILLGINDGQSVDLMVNSTPVHFILNVGQSKSIDLDSDDFADVRITLNAITDGRANITIELLNKPANAGRVNYYQQTFLIFFVVLFLIWAIWRKEKREEERKKEAKENREVKRKSR
jgi:hypothetical protein